MRPTRSMSIVTTAETLGMTTARPIASTPTTYVATEGKAGGATLSVVASTPLKRRRAPG